LAALPYNFLRPIVGRTNLRIWEATIGYTLIAMKEPEVIDIDKN